MKKLTTEKGCIKELLKSLPEPILLPLCMLSKPPVAPKLLDDNPDPEPEPGHQDQHPVSGRHARAWHECRGHREELCRF